MKKLIITLLVFSFVGLSFTEAQQATFATTLLASLAKDIRFQPVDTLSKGYYKVGMMLDKEVIAEYDSCHVVTHLGVRLFDPQMKKDLNPLVYNFLERYLLELCLWKDKQTLARKLTDDKVFFTKGSVVDFAKVKDNSLFSVSRVENKYYEVSWRRNVGGSPFLSLAFPIQYELLLGTPQVEIERTVHESIIRSPNFNELSDLSNMSLVKGNVYVTSPKKFYQLPDVNTCTYYTKDKNNHYQLICDSLHPRYSAMNIFHVLTKVNNPVSIEQSIYGFKKLNYVVSLQQWLNYCHAENLTVYTAVETEYENGIKVLVIAESKDLGYNHLLSVIVPKDFFTNGKSEFSAKLNAFITTHNVKNLYEQYKKGTKKVF